MFGHGSSQRNILNNENDRDDKSPVSNRTSNATRVTQLDALELDEQIVQIMKNQLFHAFKIFPPYILDKWEPEIGLIIQTIIWHLSIQRTDMSFGQRLLGIKYQKLNRFKKTALITPGLLRYLERRLGNSHFSTSNSKVSLACSWIKRSISICNFVNILIFLRKGVYPNLLLRLLGVSMQYGEEGSKHRNVGYSHMTRELLWHGFAELLMYVVPMINYHRIRRIVVNAFLVGKHQSPKKFVPQTVLTTSTCCSVCAKRPVLPHQMGCNHVFCYFCINANILADSRFPCPDCGHQAEGPSSIFEVPTVVEHYF